MQDGELWTDIGIGCRYCGGALQARHVPKEFEISGLQSLAYRHAETGSPICTQVFSAAPYDGWRASRAYDEARWGGRADGAWYEPVQGEPNATILEP